MIRRAYPKMAEGSLLVRQEISTPITHNPLFLALAATATTTVLLLVYSSLLVVCVRVVENGFTAGTPHALSMLPIWPEASSGKDREKDSFLSCKLS
jgi:precorrin-4 methylase